MQVSCSDWRTYSRKSVTTDKNGAFAAQDIYPTTYDVFVDQNDKVTAKPVKGVVVKAGETAMAGDMVAVPGAFVSGKVVDAETGKPVTAGQVMVYGPMTGDRSQFSFEIDNQGHFKFRTYPGKVRIIFSNHDGQYRFNNERKELDVADAGLSDIVLKARAAETVSGKVVDANGKPVEGASVNLNGQWGTEATTNKEGVFTAMLAPEEDRAHRNEEDKQIIVEAIHQEEKSGIFLRMDREEVLKNKDLLIVIKPGYQFTLTVKDSEGKPVSGAEANLLIQYDRMGKYGDVTLTDENGRVVFDVYEGGEYYPSVKMENLYFGDGHKMKRRVGSEEWQDEIEITMVPAIRTQKGKVVDEAGKPVEGAIVHAYSVNKEVKTDANGLFTLEGMPDSVVHLQIDQGYKSGFKQVDKNSGDVTVTIQ